MFKSLKINTALLLSAVFIFRILFVNIGIISSFNTQQNKGFLKAHFSSTLKRRKQVEPLHSSAIGQVSIVEICEEGSDDDDDVKSNPFLPIQILYSLITNIIKNNLIKTAPFFKPFLYNSSHRYLTFQVFRI